MELVLGLVGSMNLGVFFRVKTRARYTQHVNPVPQIHHVDFVMNHYPAPPFQHLVFVVTDGVRNRSSVQNVETLHVVLVHKFKDVDGVMMLGNVYKGMRPVAKMEHVQVSSGLQGHVTIRVPNSRLVPHAMYTIQHVHGVDLVVPNPTLLIPVVPQTKRVLSIVVPLALAQIASTWGVVGAGTIRDVLLEIAMALRMILVNNGHSVILKTVVLAYLPVVGLVGLV